MGEQRRHLLTPMFHGVRFANGSPPPNDPYNPHHSLGGQGQPSLSLSHSLSTLVVHIKLRPSARPVGPCNGPLIRECTFPSIILSLTRKTIFNSLNFNKHIMSRLKPSYILSIQLINMFCNRNIVFTIISQI